jgi:CheY-like chemotaxis protein
MVGRNRRRVFLRAELESEGREAIGHTREISEAGVVVRAEPALPVGARARVRLSLPRHVAPLCFDGTVIEIGGSGQPGDPPTMTLHFDVPSEEARRGLLAVLDRIDADDAGEGNGKRTRYRILIVDDNPMIRDLFSYGVRKYFRRSQQAVEVDVSADGLSAWNLLAAGGYDVAVIDFYLPVLDGARLCERLRGDAGLAEIVVVGISAGGHEAREAMLAAGADLFLHKPVVLRDLFTTLERLTEGGIHDGRRSQAGADPG